MLTRARIDQDNAVGPIVVPDVVMQAHARHLRDVTDGFAERARGWAAHDDIDEMADRHRSDNRRARRIGTAQRQHPGYGRPVPHPGITAVLRARPLPSAATQGSLFENQKGMRNRLFEQATRVSVMEMTK